MNRDKVDLKPTVVFARWVSWIGHPLVFISLSVGIIIALRLTNRAGLALSLTLLATVILPMALLLFRGFQSGRWSDLDVSIRAERVRFYPRAVINFRIKLSLHALFAFYSGVILFVVNPVVGAVAFALALLVFWSRLYLRRHDLLETLVGAFLGLLGGLVTAW